MLYKNKNLKPRSFEQDAEKLEEDWEAIGNDFKTVMGTIETYESNNKAEEDFREACFLPDSDDPYEIIKSIPDYLKSK